MGTSCRPHPDPLPKGEGIGSEKIAQNSDTPGGRAARAPLAAEIPAGLGLEGMAGEENNSWGKSEKEGDETDGRMGKVWWAVGVEVPLDRAGREKGRVQREDIDNGDDGCIGVTRCVSSYASD
jgi:hypothetical protein